MLVCNSGFRSGFLFLYHWRCKHQIMRERTPMNITDDNTATMMCHLVSLFPALNGSLTSLPKLEKITLEP